MTVKRNFSLKDRNAFRVDASADYFAEVMEDNDLFEIFNNPELKNLPRFILGEGSNTLFTEDFKGLVINIRLKGRKIIEENDREVLVGAAAGENWHELVSWAVENNFGGIENLALIPGTVGAAPVQNIAAYGESFSDVFDSLDAFNFEAGKIENFNAKACRFVYRSSVFKKYKERYVVLRVRFKLAKNPHLETSYYQIGISHNSLKEELRKIAKEPYGIKDVYNAVINIRKNKLPDYKLTPTAGSFFLNPVVPKAKYEELRSIIPELPCYRVDDIYYKMIDNFSLEKADFVKISAGRLLENLGWLGKWVGNCGVSDKHALVLVTNGKANGREVLDFSEKIKKSVFDAYGIGLENEVNIV